MTACILATKAACMAWLPAMMLRWCVLMAQKSKSMAVGGIGMVCTANYNARKFGVRAAMPGFIARRLCPDLVFVKPDFQKYTTASHATRDIFRTFDADFEAGSLDEAYLDLTEYCKQHSMTGEVIPRPGPLRPHYLSCSSVSSCPPEPCIHHLPLCLLDYYYTAQANTCTAL